MSEGSPRPPGHLRHQYEVEISSSISRRRRSALYNEKIEVQLKGPPTHCSHDLVLTTPESKDTQEASQNTPEPRSPQLTPIKVILSLQKRLSTSSVTPNMAAASTNQVSPTRPINNIKSTTSSTTNISPTTLSNNLSKANDAGTQVATEITPPTETPNCKLQEFICCRNSKALGVQQPMSEDHPAAKLLYHLRAHEDFPAGIRYAGGEFNFDSIACITMPSKMKWRCFAWTDAEAKTEDKGEGSADFKCETKGRAGREQGKEKREKEELVEVDADTWKDPSYVQMHGFIQYSCKEHGVGVVFRAHRRGMPELLGEAQRRASAVRRMKDGLSRVEEMMDENSEASQDTQ